MSTSKSASRRSTISVAALLGAAALLFSGIAPVSATPGAANIDDTRTGSITIHKFAEPDTAGPANNGQQLEPSVTEGLSPLGGVEFTISKFDGINLDTAAGWDELAGITVDSERPKTVVETVTTNASGLASRGGLELGLYLVEETGVGDNQVVQRAEPFLVSIPTASVDNTWLYDVHAYPKNSVVTIDMTVNENSTFGLNNGPIDWTVETSVPRLPAGQNFKSYELRIELDERLDLPSDAWEKMTISIGDFRGLLSDIGATIEPGAPGSPDVLVIKPSSQEELSLLSERQGEEVSIFIPSQIARNEIAGGSIKNTVTVSVNGSDPFADAATTDWGAVKIITRTSTSGEGLEGAVYEVRRADGTSALEVGGKQEFVTDENGAVIIPGLRAGDGYVLVEVQAPRGYQAVNAPIPFSVVAAGISEVRDAENAEEHPNVIDFKNNQVSGFALPITGSFGSLPFLIGGLLLVAIALIVNRSRRRRLAQAV